jgi:hypothetical protein
MNAVRKQSQAPPPIPFPWEARFARVLSIPPAISASVACCILGVDSVSHDCGIPALLLRFVSRIA